MKKIKLFCYLNRTQKVKYFMLFLMFLLTSIILSATLLVSQNNIEYYQPEIETLTLNSLNPVYQQMENILNIFSAASIMIAVWGGVTLFAFKDNAMEKTFIICKLYGMLWRDLLYKAFIDLFFFGIIASAIGGIGGCYLFKYIVLNICDIHVQINFISRSIFFVLLKESIILCTIAFCGSLISATYVFNKNIMNILNQRMNAVDNHLLHTLSTISFLIITIEIFCCFQKSARYIFIMFAIVIMMLLLLYSLFCFVFFRKMEQKRNKKELKNKIGLSYRFLCSHHKKDAILAATLSIGAVIICVILNIKFNFTGIITDSYRDNMGYSVGIRITEIEKKEEIQKKLDDNGYKYTMVYSKLVPYNILNGKQNMEGEFWATIIGDSTDNNKHFTVPLGEFAVESYFSNYANVFEGVNYEIFNKTMKCNRIIMDNQALSIVNYSLLINERDWIVDIDSSWSAVFLLNLSHGQIKDLNKMMETESCEIETASMIADALVEIFSDYLVIVSIIGSILIYVIFVFLYSVIQNDLIARKSEIILYQIYGASHAEAKLVIYQEYLMVAIISSFSVIFTVMILGEAFFAFFLHKHYPISLLVICITTCLVAIFVMVCCFIAEKFNSNKRKMEVIRDE